MKFSALTLLWALTWSRCRRPRRAESARPSSALADGQTVADVGAGNGDIAREAATRVGGTRIGVRNGG